MINTKPFLKKSFYFVLATLGGISTTLTIHGCAPGVSETGFIPLEFKQSTVTNGDQTTPVVCDPFGGNGPEAGHGLFAELTYIPNTSVETGGRYTCSSPFIRDHWNQCVGNTGGNSISVYDFDFDPINNPEVRKAEASLLLSRLDVTTRDFQEGFSYNGNKLKSVTGEDLDEWFALNITGGVKAKNATQEGFYQFALLSDDGSIMNIQESTDSEFQRVISNDNLRPNTFSCSMKGSIPDIGHPLSAFYISKDQTLPIHIKYFQGPRTRLAIVLLWRKVDQAHSPLDSECEQSRDGYYYFDYINGQLTAKAPYNELTGTRTGNHGGWSIIPAENLFLPNGITATPCE